MGQRALELIGELYAIEREAAPLSPARRLALRQEKTKPLADALHAWMLAQRQRVLNGTGTAKALDYSLKRWTALTRYLDDPFIPIDNNHIYAVIGINMIMPPPGLCRLVPAKPLPGKVFSFRQAA